KNAVIMGDHGQGQDVLSRAARDLDLAWKTKGVRVHYVDLAPSAKKYSIEYFKKLDIPNDPITDRYSRLDDDLQLMSIDRDRKWVREDKILPEDRKVLSGDVGKMFVDRKIRTVVEQIQKLTAAK